MTHLFHEYQLTDAEKEIIDAYRKTDLMGKTMIASAAKVAPKNSKESSQTATVIKLGRPR